MEKGKRPEEPCRRAAKVHCLTNPVSMQDVANILLAAGGSAIMAQDAAEAAQITALCQATLLNTGVPDEEKFRACAAAGKRANEMDHPVILDPVGVGASDFRKKRMGWLLERVHPAIIRCNPEEAQTLLRLRRDGVCTGAGTGEGPGGPSAVKAGPFRAGIPSGGVESALAPDVEERSEIARRLALAYGCVAFLSGEDDAISDGGRIKVCTGGDKRMARITGSGCMLSALCAFFAGSGMMPYEAACTAAAVWKESARLAGLRADRTGGGIGSFHAYLFDAAEQLCLRPW